MKDKKHKIEKLFSTIKKTSGKITIPDLKLYYRAIVIKTNKQTNKQKQHGIGTETVR